jgi:hypothetical protein
MTTELQQIRPINDWEEVPTIYPICEDINIQHLRDPGFSFDHQDQYNAIHEIEEGVLIFFEEDAENDAYLGSCIVIARREDLIANRYRNFRYIVLSGRRSLFGFRNLIALEVRRLRSS